MTTITLCTPNIYISTYRYVKLRRSNMGNARVLGMEDELELSGYRFNLALTAFFITYVLFEV